MNYKKMLRAAGSRRSLATEVRADDGNLFQIAGIVVRYSTLSEPLGGFREQIAPDAFKESLARRDDVKCLLNHSANHVLGRIQNDTLRLASTDTALTFRCQLDREQDAHRALYSSVRRGDISEMSFAFSCAPDDQTWDDVKDANGKRFLRRTVRKATLLDVSPVTYPAYKSTSVEARKVSSAHRARHAPAPIVYDFSAHPAYRAARQDAINQLACERIGAVIAEDRDFEKETREFLSKLGLE